MQQIWKAGRCGHKGGEDMAQTLQPVTLKAMPPHAHEASARLGDTCPTRECLEDRWAEDQEAAGGGGP